ncbi:MAG: MFS transporter [Chloroflexota bacterium]
MKVDSAEEATYRRVRNPWLVQLAVGFGTIITTIDSSSINIALYTVAADFGVDMGTASWLPLIAFLIVTSTLLMFGRLSDQLGAKNVFIAGLGIYGLGSLASGLAPSFPLLLACRGLQSVGISMMSANALAILTECIPPHQRGSAVGVYSAVVGLGYFAGPLIAGLVINSLGWRYVFLILVPVAALGILTSIPVLPRSHTVKGRRFDFQGAGFFAFATTALLLGINTARGSSPTAAPVLGLVGIAVVAFSAFVWTERRVAEPMLDLGLFRIRVFSASLISAFFLFFSITGEELLLPLFVQQILRENAATAGVIVAIVPFFRMVLSSPVGMLSDRYGQRWLMVVGAALTMLGMLGLSMMDAHTALVWIGACMVAIGLGQGLFFSPNMHAIMTSVPSNRLGVGSGALGLRRNLGQSLGVAVAAYLLQTGGAGLGGAVAGYQLGFFVATVALVLSAVVAYAGGSTHRA